MVEPAVMVTGRTQLAERLAQWPGSTGEETWAMVFVGAIPSAGELAAAREAAKLCDRVVAVRLPAGEKIAPKMAEICREAGIDAVWVPKEITGFVKVDCGVEKLDGTIITQALMTVMPLLVVAHRSELQLVRALRNIQGGLGEVFSLRLVG